MGDRAQRPGAERPLLVGVPQLCLTLSGGRGGPQVQQVQDDGHRLQKAYAGDKAEEIGRHMQAVAEAWTQLQGSSAARRQLLLDTTDKFRFFKAVRELMLWMDGVNLQMDAQERPR